MPLPLPPGLKAKLVGNLNMRISPQDNMNTSIVKQVSLDIHFSWDFTGVMIGLGWPTILFDNSAPLSPATTTLKVTLQEARLGTFDLNTGHMELPITLHLDYTPDFFLGKRDQDIEITLSTQVRMSGGSPGLRLWEFPPSIDFGAETKYDIVKNLSMILNGDLSPLPLLILPQASHPVVCSSDPAQDRLDLFVRGMDDAIWYRWFGSNPWSGSAWHSLGGVLTSDPAVVALGTPLIYVFARGTDNALWFKSVSLSGGITGQSSWASLGGVLTSSPAVCSLGPDRLDVFVRGTDNALWYKAFDGQVWADWVSFGGSLTSSPAVMAMRGAAWIFVRGTGNALDFMWFRSFNDQSSWQRLDGVLSSAPAVCSVTPERDQIDVFARRAQHNELQYTRFDGHTWSEWVILGGEWTSDPSAMAMGGAAWVFARGTDNAPYFMWLRGLYKRSDWQRLDGSLP
jgi:hypothetical protein